MHNSILITGTHGFLGRNAASFFSKKGFSVVGIGHGKLNSSKIKQFGIDEWNESDITIESLLKIKKQFHAIIHCAGGSSVPYSFTSPEKDFQKTVGTTLAVLEYMKRYNPLAKLIYPSSAAVYGITSDNAIKETSSYNPVSPYGYNKTIVEQLCKSYAHFFHLRINIIRFFSLYGPYLKRQLLYDACKKISSPESTLRFYGTGDETRDFLYIEDALNLILQVIKGKNQFQIINGGSGKNISIKKLIHLLLQHFNLKKKIIFTGDTKVGDPKYYLANIHAAKKLNWKPNISLVQGVKEYVRWFKEQNK